MHILNIGYGRRVFLPENSERARLALCASATDSFHLIIFSLRSDGLQAEQVSEKFFLYPTHSSARLLMLFDAVRIGLRILRTRKNDEQWSLAAQDPLAAGVVGYVLRLWTRLPLLIEEHGDIFSGTYWRNESRGNHLWYWVAKYIVRRAQGVRAVSVRVREHLVLVGVAKEKIVLLPVHTDISHFAQEVSDRKEESKNHSVCTVLSVARFVPQKNLILLLRAFAALYATHKNIRLVLVGQGPLQGVLEAEMGALHITEAVTLLPWSDDVPSLMRSADIYALTSNYEGWGRVLVEAMVCGLPAVTTEVGCVGEVFLDGVHGLVVPVGDTASFTEALRALVEDTEKRKRFSVSSVEDSQKLFSDTESYIRAWAAIHQFAESPSCGILVAKE